ncbi:tail fiber domain-containing protein [Roseburia sp. AF12-17LB]|uniref:tail fiber domain-containing protein n=1 Tax=Roseburia sp. AF12-17LB TaxID=2293127 RepID=UPI000E48ADDD|nr:tail fiber domain-containing protein [Roseburia sp. AF12-17LB]RHS29075.1 tail fiber domain-containing protein [Roseburia sp. AF12-17LB]
MSYEKVNWKNYPDKSTLISAENLGHMDDGIKALDDEKLNIDKITQSTAVNQDGYALDAREKNASISGTMANQISKLKTDVNKKQDASTAITTSNIGSQSVKYATSAGSANAVAWSKVTGKPSSYPPASHSHAGQALDAGALEITAVVPYIDFHYNNSNADFTSRIVDYGPGGGFQYSSSDGNHYFKNTSNGNQTACLKANGSFGAGAGGTAIIGNPIYMAADWNSSGYATVYGASFTNPSSKLVKKNVADLSKEEAKKILQLTPVSFDYIKEFGGDKDQRGLIAEDVLNIIPSCVQIPDGYSEEEFNASKGIKNKVLAIDYSKLVPYLIKMVQIQQEEIEKLKEAMNKEGGKENE